MHSKKIRAMSEGSMIGALFGSLFFLDLYMGGMIGYYLTFILPVLFIWYIKRYDIKQAMILGVVILFVVLFTGNIASVMNAIVAIISGLALGYGYTHNFSGNKMYSIATIISLVNNILIYTVFAKLLDMDIIKEMIEIYGTLKEYLSIPISVDTFVSYAPLVIFFLGLIEGYCLMMVMTLLAPRLKLKFHYEFNILDMQLPKVLAVVLFVFFILSRYYDYMILNYLGMIGFILIMIQGLTLFLYYFATTKKVLFYFLAILLVIIPTIEKFYFGMGILDIVVGLKRKIMYNK